MKTHDRERESIVTVRFSVSRCMPVVTCYSWKQTLSAETFSVHQINKHVNVWMLYVQFRIQMAVIRFSFIVCIRERE